MSATAFTIERVFNASSQQVWKAITHKDQMKKWYFELSEFKPEIGFEFSFAGQGHKGEQYIHLCVVTEVVEERKLSYTWTYQNYPGNSVVTFELFPEGDKTRVKLTHAGLETFPQNSQDFAKESFSEGWTYLIGKSLKEFLETEEK